MNLTSFFLLSNKMLNFEKTSFLPRINGLCSLLDKAQVISVGIPVILTVILAICAVILPPSIPEKRIFSKAARSIPRSFATDFGMMLQSAPVSTRKSNSWYPYRVKTGMEMTGSATIPNRVRFWFRGKSERINADSAFGGDKPDDQSRPVYMFLDKFFYKLGICPCVSKDMAIFPRYIFAGIPLLKLCIGNCFHFSHLPKNIIYPVVRKVN